VFSHGDGGGFNIMLQAFPLDGKIVCREVTAGDVSEENGASQREQPGRPATRKSR
jgi:hypothetical protein